MLNIKVSLIVAMDKNRVIGKDNDLPWRLPKEFEYVKKTTMGHTLVMGRKNFESIGRVLPGRKNVILTRDKDFSFEGCVIAHSIKEVFELCKNDEEIFIFGGEQIYEMFLPYVEKMYITKIDYAFEGDTFFPEVNYEEWDEVSVKLGTTDEKNPYTYHFHINKKNKDY